MEADGARMEAAAARMEAAAARFKAAKGKGGKGGAQRGEAWHDKKRKRAERHKGDFYSTSIFVWITPVSTRSGPTRDRGAIKPVRFCFVCRDAYSRGSGRVRGASGARDAADGRGRTRGRLTSSFSARAKKSIPPWR